MHYWPWGHTGQSEVGITGPFMHYWPWGHTGQSEFGITGPFMHYWPWGRTGQSEVRITGPVHALLALWSHMSVRGRRHWPPSCITGPGVAQVSQRSALLAPFMHYWPWGHTGQSEFGITGPLHALLALGSHRSVRGPHYWPRSCIIGPGVTLINQNLASLAHFMHYRPWGRSVRGRRHWPPSCIIGPGVIQVSQKSASLAPFMHYWPWSPTGQSEVHITDPLHALLALDSHRSVRGPHYWPFTCIIAPGVTQVSQRSASTSPLHALLALGSHRSVRGPRYLASSSDRWILLAKLPIKRKSFPYHDVIILSVPIQRDELLKTKCCRGGNFVVTGGATGYRNDNIRCRQPR